jgi:hypothetical protein
MLKQIMRPITANRLIGILLSHGFVLVRQKELKLKRRNSRNVWKQGKKGRPQKNGKLPP